MSEPATQIVPVDNPLQIIPATLIERVSQALLAIMAQRDDIVRSTYEAQEDLKAVKGFSVATQEDLDNAVSGTADLKKELKRLETIQKAALKPLLELENTIRGIYRPVLTSLAESEKLLKGKIATGMKFLQEEQNRALRLVSELSREGDLVQAKSVLMRAPAAELPKQSTIRSVWKFRVKDAALVEDKYLMVVVNDGAVQAAVDAGVREIAGIEIYEENPVTIRQK